MRHEIRLQGAAFALRPVELSDARLIVALRTDGDRTRFLHPTPPSIQAQEEFLERYFAREGDYYFVVERRDSHVPEGLISVYDIDSGARCGEWGRWVVRSGSLAAVESVLLIFRAAFEVLDLEMVYSRTLVQNERVVSFHESCGLETHAVLPRYTRIGGEQHDAIEHRLTRARWPQIEPGLRAHADRIARLLGRTAATS
ncbi:MAG: GNAT family N-acetyltransferase [Gemmatimonadaceae bacterium]